MSSKIKDLEAKKSVRISTVQQVATPRQNVYSLKADKPITKQYALGPKGEIVKSSYPFVYKVTSTEHSITSIDDLFHLVREVGKEGSCLLKGEIKAALKDESRAGSTDPQAPTSWICLDLDGIDNFQTVDLFLQEIGCSDIDYVLQWSSSMGLENAAGFRCHIFMLLAKPQSPEILKRWLMELNLSIPTLAAQLQLTKTNNALRWPLDITTCQNDKLLYVAPPKLGKGIKDPFPKNDRVQLHKRKHRTLDIPYPVASREALRQLSDVAINAIREALKLPKRKPTVFKYSKTTEYMARPDRAEITSIKEERGFVYLNLNGGDSWGYYHPMDNFEFIHNFKGEPVYRTEDLIPEYWAQLQQDALERAAEYLPDADGKVYIAFRDFDSSQFYNAIYDTIRNDLIMAQAKTETQLRQFMAQHNQVVGECVPDWRLTFDPLNTTVVDRDNRVLNTFQPSEYFKNLRPKVVRSVPKTILKVISQVLTQDSQCIERFLNWLACIVQYRVNTGTAWVLHGATGTGKGTLINKILTPLFHPSNTSICTMTELNSQFNGFMRNAMIVWVDESQKQEDVRNELIGARIRNMITEPRVPIREMYRDVCMAPNRANFIFASNHQIPVEIVEDDRRFNVAPRQMEKLKISDTEIKAIDTELADFYAFLMHHPADQQTARTPLQNLARARLISNNQTAADLIAKAILEGDLTFFWEQLPSTKPLNDGFSPNALAYEAYRTLLIELLKHQPLTLTRDELYTLFRYPAGRNVPDSSHKFTSFLKHHGIDVEVVWHKKPIPRSVRGINVVWQTDKDWIKECLRLIDAGAA